MKKTNRITGRQAADIMRKICCYYIDECGPIDEIGLEKVLSYFERWMNGELNDENDFLTEVKFDAQTVATFCMLINQAGIIKKKDAESAEAYCKRIWNIFWFEPIPPNTRKYFHYGKVSEKKFNDLKEKLSPYLQRVIKKIEASRRK